MLKSCSHTSPSIQGITADQFPSLHTLIIWTVDVDFEDVGGNETGYKLLLNPFGRFSIKHLTCGDITSHDCQHLLFALALYDGQGGQARISLEEAGRESDSQIGNLQNAGLEHRRLLYLPNLQTLTIIPSGCEWVSFPLITLRRVLTIRKAIGHPIQKLYISEEYLEDVRREFTLEEGLVSVEKWQPQFLPNYYLWPEYIWDLRPSSGLTPEPSDEDLPPLQSL